jgi:hypothetical protein
MASRLSALRAGRTLTQKDLLVLVYDRGWVNSNAILRLKGLGQLQKFNYLIETRIRGLQTSSTAPQPSTLLGKSNIQQSQKTKQEFMKSYKLRQLLVIPRTDITRPFCPMHFAVKYTFNISVISRPCVTTQRERSSSLSFCLQNNTISSRIMLAVKALCYKPEGRGFDTRLDEILSLPNPSGRTRPWVLLSL